MVKLSVIRPKGTKHSPEGFWKAARQGNVSFPSAVRAIILFHI